MARVWTIPAARRKTERARADGGRDFVVPLNLGMVRCLRRARTNRVGDLGPGDLMFPSYRGKGLDDARPFNSNSLLVRLRAFGFMDEEGQQIDIHGFRTTVARWGLSGPHRARPPFEETVMDKVLSHTVSRTNDSGKKVSRAFKAYLGRSDPFLGQRKIVMREWHAHLCQRPYGPPRATEGRPALRLVA